MVTRAGMGLQTLPGEWISAEALLSIHRRAQARQWGESDVQAEIRRLTQPQGRLESECPEVAGQLLVRTPSAPRRPRPGWRP